MNCPTMELADEEWKWICQVRVAMSELRSLVARRERSLVKGTGFREAAKLPVALFPPEKSSGNNSKFR